MRPACRIVFVGLLLLGLTWLPPASADCDPVRLAAFDVGSGTTRMRVVELWPCDQGRWVTVLAEEANIAFAADLLETGNGSFSPALRESATERVSGLVDVARTQGAVVLTGVATQAFRRATNAADLVADWRVRFGLDIDIISQQAEGRLAYQLIEARRADRADRANLVVWDIGGGSQQLVWRDPRDASLHHFNSTLASVSFRRLAMTHLGRPYAATSPNPISPAEAEALLLLAGDLVAGEIPQTLRLRIAEGAQVVGVGGVHGASLTRRAGIQAGQSLSRPLLEQTLSEQLGKDDQAIGGAYADTDVTNLILVLGLMREYGIDAYEATRHDLTEALLLDWSLRRHESERLEAALDTLAGQH